MAATETTKPKRRSNVRPLIVFYKTSGAVNAQTMAKARKEGTLDDLVQVGCVTRDPNVAMDFAQDNPDFARMSVKPNDNDDSDE